MPWTTTDTFTRWDNQLGYLKTQTVSALGPTEWVALGDKVQMLLSAPIGGAFVAAAQIEQSLTDPTGTATPVALGAAVHGDPSARIGPIIVRPGAAGWYRVNVLRLIGGAMTIVLGDATSAGDVKA